ncbi:DNA-binding response regulator [Thermomicrobium sp. 4228-Ro]|uniref:DNA-binding response regulator n=1 Tax=Thermomicrobium sp. 4228-Ro TaxID=2993937 RepID=UPI0022494548|nr:DNA-binding response regulator [Thermomicrobium sp. 4228-Ro]MCX2728098.1 DNA-binding response regulator [Thermomicrobium sp. 4228-Ro]
MARILLVPDDALGWQDLAAQLARCPGITAVQLAGNPATAAQLGVTWQPDLVLLGAGLLREQLDPGLRGLVQRAPSVLLAHALPAQLLAALLDAGLPLRGVLTWVDLDRAAVPAVAALLTQSPLPVAGPTAAAQLAALWREQVGRPRLSPVEQRLLPLLAEWDLTYAAIAARMGVTPATVKARVRRLALELGVPAGRGPVVEAARQRGLLPP